MKHPAAITDFNTTHMTVAIGKNITATRTPSAEAAIAPATVTFISENATDPVECTALGNGTFTANYYRETTGNSTVKVVFAGKNTVYGRESTVVMETVEEPSFLEVYRIFIGGGLAAVGAVVYIKKYRE